MGSADFILLQRALPHLFALAAGVAAYLSLGLILSAVETIAVEVIVSFALIGVPVLGATAGSLISGRRGIRPVLRPYLLATLWMWGLLVVIAAVGFVVEGNGFIPNDTPFEGTVAFLFYAGISIVFLWPWFIVPTAQLIRTTRTRADASKQLGASGAVAKTVTWLILILAAVVAVFGLVVGLFSRNLQGALGFLFIAAVLAVLALVWHRGAQDGD